MILKLAVDLSKARAGNYKEDYVVKGLSNDINYNVKPKQTCNFRRQSDAYNACHA